MIRDFSGLLDSAKSESPRKVAVAVAQDPIVIEALRLSREKKIAECVLIGDEEKIVEAGVL